MKVTEQGGTQPGALGGLYEYLAAMGMGGKGELHGPPGRAVQLSDREQASWGGALCGGRNSWMETEGRVVSAWQGS